jgi:chitin disaccharide deacetylase
MRRLIINADDLGMNPQRTHGIFQCFEYGVVTSTSILPNMTDSATAAKHAREKGLPAGLHLNFTEDYPLSKPDDVSSLVDANGMFHPRERFWQLLEEGAIVQEHLEREIRAQVEWFFDNNGSPTHVDGHMHMHIFGIVIEALIPVLERYGIRFVRIPYETLPPHGYVVPPERLAFAEKINAAALRAREVYTAHGIQSTDHFRGLTLQGNASLKNIRHIINKLPEGTTELMVHPGSAISFGTPFDLDPQRQTELRMLQDPSIRELLNEKKVELISYGDL